MPTETPKTILLKGRYSRRDDQYLAGSPITPGDLCEITSAGTVIEHNTPSAIAEKMFAMEDSLVGKNIGQEYASGARVSLVWPQTGDEIYAWLSAGENAAIGSLLNSSGDGTLKVGTTNIIGVALEAVNLSAESADSRIRIRVL